MTTAVSLPRTATAVTPAPEIALNAYSDYELHEHNRMTHRLDTAVKDVSKYPQGILGKYDLLFLQERRQ
jgi:hypothetical protein